LSVTPFGISGIAKGPAGRAVDRAKGICVSAFNVTHQHPWFWTLIGVDQTLHHLTGFGLAIVMAFNA
jgi:hypothetical protein